MTRSGEMPKVHTLMEAAAILRVKTGWLQRKAAKRAIPFTMLGGTYHFTAEHIAEIVRINEQRPAIKAEPMRRNRRFVQQSAMGDVRSVAPLRPRSRKNGPRHAA